MVGLDRTLQMGSAKPGSRKRGLDRAWIAGGSRMDRARETGAPTPVLLAALLKTSQLQKEMCVCTSAALT